MSGVDINRLCAEALAGGKRAIGRLITLAENDLEARQQILSRLHEHTGRAYVLGITGPPGAGKSSLTDKLAKFLLTQPDGGESNFAVGIIAVDPSSPFSGGAILGDRIRMNDLCLEPRVFIRSLGSRGALDGLSQAVASAVQILDACGCRIIIIETVGVGQAATAIRQLAHTTLVVSVPGLGDDIQMIKAGILEIGDILVVNKADRDGAKQLADTLTIVHSRPKPWQPGWQTPVLLTCAAGNQTNGRGGGIADLWQAVESHRDYLQSNNLKKEW